MIVSTAVLEASSLVHHHQVEYAKTHHDAGNNNQHPDNQQNNSDTKPQGDTTKHDSNVNQSNVNPTKDATTDGHNTHVSHPIHPGKHIQHETSNTHPDAIKDMTVVHQGEGIEHTFIRQIEHDPAKFGFSGDLKDAHAVHTFAQHQAHTIAIKEGYVDNAGHEVRVSEVDKASYELKTDGHGHVTGVEEKFDEKIVETREAGHKFEAGKNEYMGTKHHEVGHGGHPVHHTAEKIPTTHTESHTPETASTHTPTAEEITRQKLDAAYAKANNPTVEKTGVNEKGEAGSAPADKDSQTTGQGATSKGVQPNADSSASLNDIHAKLVGTPFEKENFGLPTEKVTPVNEVYQRLYTGRDHDIWNQVKTADADSLVGAKPNGTEADNAVLHFNNVLKHSGIIPDTGTPALNIPPEKVDHFMARAYAEIMKKEGGLDKVKDY
jgi:hypothetical protein